MKDSKRLSISLDIINVDIETYRGFANALNNDCIKMGMANMLLDMKGNNIDSIPDALMQINEIHKAIKVVRSAGDVITAAPAFMLFISLFSEGLRDVLAERYIDHMSIPTTDMVNDLTEAYRLRTKMESNSTIQD